MNPYEFNEFMEKLRNGEKVICPCCKKGVMIAVGDFKTTKSFHCDSCKKDLILINTIS